MDQKEVRVVAEQMQEVPEKRGERTDRTSATVEVAEGRVFVVGIAKRKVQEGVRVVEKKVLPNSSTRMTGPSWVLTEAGEAEAVSASQRAEEGLTLLPQRVSGFLLVRRESHAQQSVLRRSS
jgi:hypothetical protein